MMVGRIVLVVVVLIGLAFSSGARAADMRQAYARPDVTEFGDPVLISREVLDRELAVNSEMRTFVAMYGWPDYAEVQEVTVVEPLASYEVRLYYLRRNHELAFSRVHVSPVIHDFGVRTYEGPIPEATLARLLTASGEVEPPKVAAAPQREPWRICAAKGSAFTRTQHSGAR